jgi:hypothetical protein
MVSTNKHFIALLLYIVALLGHSEMAVSFTVHAIKCNSSDWLCYSRMTTEQHTLAFYVSIY